MGMVVRIDQRLVRRIAGGQGDRPEAPRPQERGVDREAVAAEPGLAAAHHHGRRDMDLHVGAATAVAGGEAPPSTITEAAGPLRQSSHLRPRCRQRMRKRSRPSSR